MSTLRQHSNPSLMFENFYGNNRGGWYRDLETGERKYVKMYSNPDQTRVEVLTNSFYDAAGIPATHSALDVVEGRLAIVSDEVIGDMLIPYGEREVKLLQNRPEIMGGFAVDAWLANYDVFGYMGDNVIQQPDGTVVRIDYGGSMQFRARGKIKPFPHDSVPELMSMRDPNVIPMSDPSVAQSTAGRVFHALTEEDIASQVSSLFSTITEKDILDLAERVDFDPDTHNLVTRALVGRRAYLMRLYDV